MDSGELGEAMLSAPVGAGVLVVAARSGFGLAGLTDPVTVTALTAAVCAELTPWSGYHRDLATWLVEQARPLHAMAADTAQHPATAWWTRPPDRDTQLALGPDDTARDRDFELTGGDWEVYAQQPSRAVTTATALTADPGEAIRSGRHAVLAAGGSDWQPEYPLPQALLPVHADARSSRSPAPGTGTNWSAPTRPPAPTGGPTRPCSPPRASITAPARTGPPSRSGSTGST